MEHCGLAGKDIGYHRSGHCGQQQRQQGRHRDVEHKYLHSEQNAGQRGFALLRFQNGSVGMIEGSVNTFGGDWEETLTLFGEKGRAKLGGKCVNVVEEWHFADGDDAESRAVVGCGEDPPNVYGFGHKSLYADMLEAIRDDRKPYVSSAAGRRALETVLASYRSAADGKPVSLPLASGSTLDFKE